VTGATTRPSRKERDHRICTPRLVSRWCQGRVASEAHGVISGPAFTPISRATSRLASSVTSGHGSSPVAIDTANDDEGDTSHGCTHVIPSARLVKPL
jgi:hypothetical protein